MIVIDKWAGLVTNISPYSLPPGAAATQVNLQVIVPGQLSVRPGMAAVTWSSVSVAATTQANSGVVRIFRAPCNGQERLIYQNAAGQIFEAKGPA